MYYLIHNNAPINGEIYFSGNYSDLYIDNNIISFDTGYNDIEEFNFVLYKKEFNIELYQGIIKQNPDDNDIGNEYRLPEYFFNKLTSILEKLELNQLGYIIYIPSNVRNSEIDIDIFNQYNLDDDTKDLLLKMTKIDEDERISVEDALKHNFFKDIDLPDAKKAKK